MMRDETVSFRILFFLLAVGSYVEAGYDGVPVHDIQESDAAYEEVHGADFVGNNDICNAAGRRVNLTFDENANPPRIGQARSYSIFPRADTRQHQARTIHAVACGIQNGDFFYVQLVDQANGEYVVYYKRQNGGSASRTETTGTESSVHRSESHTWGSYLRTGEMGAHVEGGEEVQQESGWTQYLQSSDEEDTNSSVHRSDTNSSVYRSRSRSGDRRRS